ncbi:MAG: transporter [Verrucomicrobiales bacterium]|nr:transporter [Verrucomicrobiales bacterium]
MMTPCDSIKTIRSSFSALTVAIALMPLSVSAGDHESKNAASYSGTTDKTGYTLFNPTPRELWRELSPDRPDATESPLTVDAGAYVIEASFFDWRHDGGDDTYTFMSTNFKVGLTNRIDLQTVFDTYAFENGANNADGFGDVQFRLKYNVWGKDDGGSAFAIFPFVKVPTGTELSNGKFEGGLILPFSMDLNDRVGLGIMGEIDYVYDDVANDYDVEFLHSVVLGFDLTAQIGLFTEYIGITGPSPYQAYAAGGLTFSISEDLVFDCGTQLGLNSDSEEIGAFCGFTKRF